MKKYLLYSLILIAIPFFSFSQDTKDSSFLINTGIPELKILLPDSTEFTNKDLPKKKQIVIIYFSTECSHCQYEAKEMSQKLDSLSNAFFVWIDYHHSLKEITEFTTKYGLSSAANMKFGKEETYRIVPYYRIAFTPYMAIYNKQAIFTKEFREGATVTELYNAINK